MIEKFLIKLIITWVFILTAVTIIYKRYKEEDEKNLGFKLVGYYMMGGFNLIIFGFPVPFGILLWGICTPKKNRRLKKRIAYFSFITLIITSMIPSAYRIYNNRTRYFRAENVNVYNTDEIQGVFNTIKDKLDVDGQFTIHEIDLEYYSSGIMKEIFMRVYIGEDGDIKKYIVCYDPDIGKYAIKLQGGIDTPNYVRLIQEQEYIWAVKRIGLKGLHFEKDEESYDLYVGGFARGEIGSKDNYIITNDGIVNFGDSEEECRGYRFLTEGRVYILPTEK